MKLPFHNILTPILRPNLRYTKLLCQHPTFAMSYIYTYFYGALGFMISAMHLKNNLGHAPSHEENLMLVHDLKIIATSMGLVQYGCLIVGCLTENPALFLPHLGGQLLAVTVKSLNVLASPKSFKRFVCKVPAIALMTFNWLQEFCVFRQALCICDL